MHLDNLAKKIDSLTALTGYLLSPRQSIHYTGWIGYSNLGDELLLDAARTCFEPIPLTWVKDYRSRSIQSLVEKKRHRVAMLGGGTQIGDHSPISRFKAALARSSTGIVFGAGVTPSTSGPIPKWLDDWGAVLRNLPYVGVRGTESVATLQRVGVDAKVLGDPVCWFTRDVGYWEPTPKLLGINVGQSNGNMYGQESEIQEKISQFVRQSMKRGCEFEFFCVWPDDLEVTKRVASMAGLSNPTIHEIYHDVSYFQERVRRMNAFVGIKLHAVALAMVTGVPSLMIEYRPKCREFMASLGMERFVHRSDQIEVDSLITDMEDLMDSGSFYSKTILTNAAIIRDRIKCVSHEIISTHFPS